MTAFTRAQINAAATELYGVFATYDPAQVARALEAAAALSTPPADDVREALTESLEDFMQDWYDRWAGPGETWVARDMATSIVEDWLPKVRPHGTFTDTETAWEYGVRHVAVDGWPTNDVHVSLDAARADFATCGMSCHLIRRRSAQDAGKWEPIDASGEVRS